MRLSIKRLLALPLMLTMLSGCVSFSATVQSQPQRPLVKAQTVSLANVPSDLRTCFTSMTGMPVPGSMSRREAVELITALRMSEYRKTQCGRRMLAFYDTQARKWNKK